MTRTIRAFAAAAVLCMLSPLAALAQEQGQGELRATHGDWEIRCAAGTNNCVMSQIGSTSEGQRAILVSIQRLSGATAENGTPIPAAMTVQTPLGILIPYGVRIKIDADDVVPLPLSRCVPAGCVSQAPMLDEAVNKMKRGANAVFGFFLDSEVLVNVSLRGFTAAYNNLQPTSAQ